MSRARRTRGVRQWSSPAGRFTRNALLSAVLGVLFAAPSSLCAQGILTVTPGRTVATVAGTGAIGYAGDGGAASAASLANPAGVAYDASGNQFIADAQNHVVREISRSGVITTIAGSGVEGYSGDGGAATAAFLDTPTGVAVDSGGNLYIADSHNHCIRRVSAGIITTIAGTGKPGFSGDGGAATAAQLWLPTAVAVDSRNDIYIADTNNQRIREIQGGTITTIAGDGEELFAGDGASAILAALDAPTGVAVDTLGNIYVADRHNQRVRKIGVDGTITTLAGSGAASFSGGYSGDGAAATNAAMAKPSGVSVDAAGNVYIADTDNHRIRQVSGGSIVTITGSGQQGSGADGTSPLSVNLNSPRAVMSDANGNLAISDTLNQQLRTALLPVLTFASDGIGIFSSPQGVTLANTGTASISITTVEFSGPFAMVPGGSCSPPPITLDPGRSCVTNIVLLPLAVGVTSGAVVFGGSGIVPQTVLLSGNGVQTGTTVNLTSSLPVSLLGQNVTFSATVIPVGVGIPTGTISFYDGSTLIGAAQPMVAGAASFTTAMLAAGKHNITAVYSGDGNFTGNTSAVVQQAVIDFGIILATGNPAGNSSGGGSSGTQTAVPGQAVNYGFTIAPIGLAYPLPITLSAIGLPPGATATLTPQNITLGVNPVSFTMTIQTPQTVGSLLWKRVYGASSGGALAIGLLLLPLSGRIRAKGRGLRSLLVVLLSSLAALGALTGCGSGSGFFSQTQQSYTIQVIGTAAGGFTLQHFVSVTLVLQ
jgi:Bacterial Ig-like domain (group 3)/NHL repeat